jgi:hypothetical protein
MDEVTQVNVYESDGSFFYSAWCGMIHDHNDELDADNPTDAVQLAKELFPDAKIDYLDPDQNECY